MSFSPAPGSLSRGSQNPTTSIPCFLKSAIVWSRKRAFSASSFPGDAVYVRSSKTRPGAPGAGSATLVPVTSSNKKQSRDAIFITVFPPVHVADEARTRDGEDQCTVPAPTALASRRECASQARPPVRPEYPVRDAGRILAARPWSPSGGEIGRAHV